MQAIQKKIKLIFFLILIIQSNLIEGQESGFINGKLIQLKDKAPIPFATLIIKNKAKGLISNADGGFKVPYELYKKDTLVISSIGYSSKEIPLSSLSLDIINLIVLEEKIEILDEIVIVGKHKKKRIKSAKEIINIAISKIPKNYPYAPFSYIGYYRDYQLKNGEYLNLNEALMEVFDSGFGTSDLDETQTRIYQFKKNLNFLTDTIASKPYDYRNKNKIISNINLNNRGGNEYTILRIHDAIRNYNINSYDFVNRLDLNFVNNHEFKLLTDTFINNISLYSIDIFKTEGNIRISGKIHISKDDFKIYRLQYTVYDQNKSELSPEHTEKNSNFSKIKKQSIGKLLYNIIVEYKSKNRIMYPNYISFNNSFEVLRPPKFFLIDAKIHYTDHSKLNFNSIELNFNNIPLLKSALKKKNYGLRYKDKKLKIDSIEVKKNIVILHLKKKSIFEDINIEFKKIKDIYGNLINEKESQSYKQYREFFVQELKINPKKSLDTLYMIKNKSIFKNQPIAPFKNLSNYWLNTPLKNK